MGGCNLVSIAVEKEEVRKARVVILEGLGFNYIVQQQTVFAASLEVVVSESGQGAAGLQCQDAKQTADTAAGLINDMQAGASSLQLFMERFLGCLTNMEDDEALEAIGVVADIAGSFEKTSSKLTTEYLQLGKLLLSKAPELGAQALAPSKKDFSPEALSQVQADMSKREEAAIAALQRLARSSKQGRRLLRGVAAFICPDATQLLSSGVASVGQSQSQQARLTAHLEALQQELEKSSQGKERLGKALSLAVVASAQLASAFACLHLFWATLSRRARWLLEKKESFFGVLGTEAPQRKDKLGRYMQGNLSSYASGWTAMSEVSASCSEKLKEQHSEAYAFLKGGMEAKKSLSELKDKLKGSNKLHIEPALELGKAFASCVSEAIELEHKVEASAEAIEDLAGNSSDEDDDDSDKGKLIGLGLLAGTGVVAGLGLCVWNKHNHDSEEESDCPPIPSINGPSKPANERPPYAEAPAGPPCDCPYCEPPVVKPPVKPECVTPRPPVNPPQVPECLPPPPKPECAPSPPKPECVPPPPQPECPPPPPKPECVPPPPKPECVPPPPQPECPPPPPKPECVAPPPKPEFAPPAPESDFYFEGYQNGVPELDLGDGRTDRSISPRIFYRKDHQPVQVGSSNQPCVYLDGGAKPPADNQFYATSVDDVGHVFVRTFNVPMGPFKGRLVKLPLTALRLSNTLNVNWGDGNSDLPEDRRCVIFKTKA